MPSSTRAFICACAKTYLSYARTYDEKVSGTESPKKNKWKKGRRIIHWTRLELAANDLPSGWPRVDANCFHFFLRSTYEGPGPIIRHRSRTPWFRTVTSERHSSRWCARSREGDPVWYLCNDIFQSIGMARHIVSTVLFWWLWSSLTICHIESAIQIMVGEYQDCLNRLQSDSLT